MKMKRILSLLLAGAMSVSLLAACNNDEDNSSDEGSNSSAAENNDGDAEDVTLNWVLWDYEATQYYKDLIDAYQEKNPNVTIETTDLGAEDYTTQLGIQLTGGNDEYDVMSIKDIPSYNSYVKQNNLEDLSQYIADEGINTAQYGGLVEEIEVDGNVYALPFRNDFWVLFYNKDMFDAAGVDYPSNDLTLQAYADLARELQGNLDSGKFAAHYHTWRSAVSLFGILDGQHTIVDGDTYEFLTESYEVAVALQDEGVVQDYTTLKSSGIHYRSEFFAENIAMVNMGTWFVADLINGSDSDGNVNDAENWGVVKYPHPEGVEAGTTLGTITSLAVNPNSNNKDVALDFMKFVTSEEGAQIIADCGNIPAIINETTMSAIISVDGFPQDENSQTAMTEVVKTYLEMPLHDQAAEIETILNEQHDMIMGGQSSIEDAIAEMESQVGAILQ